MSKAQSGVSRRDILLPPLSSAPGKTRERRPRKPRYAGNIGENGASAAEQQAAADAAADERTAASGQHDEASVGSTDDEVRDGVVFSFLTRQRIREASTEAHGLVVERLRQAKRQGAAATPSSLAAEVAALARANREAAGAEGAVRTFLLGQVRACYLTIAASAIILAERATRPERELRRGEKSKTVRYSAPDFRVPAT